MSRKTLGIWLMLVVMVALVTACSGTTPPTTAEEKPATSEAMTEATDEAMMDKDDTGEQMMDEDEAGEEMTDKDDASEEMMDEDEAGEEMMDKAGTDEAMMDEADASEAMTVPDWFKVELTNVNTGETFRIADFQGKVVLIETMAVWCPTCARQANEIQTLHELLGERDDFVSVSLDVDPNETEEILKAYTDQNDFDWNYAVSPHEVNHALGNLYSAQYLNPPVSPLLIIDQQGQVYGLPFGGVKKATNLKPTIETYLNGG